MPNFRNVARGKRCSRLYEVVVHVANKCSAENGGEYPQLGPGAKVAQISGNKEKIEQQFLEIIIVSIPEIDDRLGQQGLVSIAEHIEAEKPQQGDPSVTRDGMPKRFPNQFKVDGDPGRDWRNRRLAGNDLIEAGERKVITAKHARKRVSRLAVKYRSQNLPNQIEQQRQDQQLQRRKHRPGVALGGLRFALRQVV